MTWQLGLAGTAFLLVLAGSAAPVLAAPLAAPVTAVEPADDPAYDAAGRRDPFRPPKATSALIGERTPLERYEIGQLRLVAIIYDTQLPRAVVEDDEGLGYIVKVGTRIGSNGGEIAAIERGRVTVREDSTDFYGEHHPVTTALELKTPERSAYGRGKR